MSGYEKTQAQEMREAYEQNRQPNCIDCSHPLDIVMQPQDLTLVWRWNQSLKKYTKSEEESSDRPYHYCYQCQDTCWAEDWDYIDYRLINF